MQNKEEGELVSREWLSCASSGDSQKNGPGGLSFRILQFNVLADALAHTRFIKCPPSALQWPYRSSLLLQEILRSEADILCLEEVDHFYDFFQPELSKRGFEGFFVATGDRCLLYPNNNGPDGHAFFYRVSKFELLKKQDIVLSMAKERKSANKVAVFAQLQVREAKNSPSLLPSSMCVVMSDFKSKPKFSDIRVAQGRHIVQETITFAQRGEPIVILGDFNSTPDDALYEFFRSQGEHPELNLRSSYAERQDDSGNEPSFTCWQFRDRGESKYTIDYIWYTPGPLRLEGVWGIPREEDIGEAGLPCAVYPSDHIALCSQFTIT